MKKIRMLIPALIAVMLWAFFAFAEQEERVIVIPGNIAEVGEEAFADDTSISAVVIPGGVSIAQNAFSGCINLKTLIVMDGADISFTDAFSETPIECVYCPENSAAEKYYKDKGIAVLPVSEYAAGSEFLTEIQPTGVVITGYTGTEKNVRIPSRIRGIPVTAIGDKAFYGNEAILSVSVPEYVTSIGDYAFYGCRSLESISLPQRIAEIGDYAFQNARNIKSLTLSKNIRALGDNPFLNCACLSSVTGLEENAYYSFTGEMIIDVRENRIVSYLSNTPATEAVVPNGIASIGKYAFSYAQTLTSVILPQTVNEISEYAFYECPSLKTVCSEGIIQKIGASAFENCERLSEITLSEGLIHLGDYAFKNCRSLPPVTLPESVLTVGKAVFHLDMPVSGTIMNIVPLYQFHYTKTICVIRGEEKSVKTSGCGATCVAMVIRYVKGDYSVTPETVFEWLYEAGFYQGDGLSHLALSRYLSISGIASRWTGSTTEVLNNLRAGKPVIAHMGPGTFADNGHYILLRGIDENGMIIINDPNSRRLSQETFSLQMIRSQLKTTDGFCIVK